MLYRSGDNLESGVIQFIEESESITLFSAYLKLDELKKINTSKKINQIIVRWEIQDLCLGVSDIELYEYCLENNIALYRNTRIHLKAFWNNNDTLIFGSANVTRRGIGELGNYNYELNGIVKSIDFQDRLYLHNIINDSEYIDDKLYLQLSDAVANIEVPTTIILSLPTLKKKVDNFLISQLPMTSTPNELFEIYSGNRNDYPEYKYAIHDISIYNIPLKLREDYFFIKLASEFNNHPFIVALKEHICNTTSKSLRYGGVIQWIVNNTTTVPTPRSWELKRKEIVNVLYDWICYFDDNFKWDRPNFSQVIYCNKN